MLHLRLRTTGCAVLFAALLAFAPGCSGSTNTEARFDGGTFAPEAPPSYTVDGLRIATLNTRFMFDGYNGEGGASFPWKGDPAAARTHRARIGDIVRALDADLVVLQEVEHGAVMDSLIAGALAGEGYAAHFVQGRDTFTGQDVGLLARVPVDTVGRTDERTPVAGTDDTYGVSKNLFARLTLDGLPVTLVGLHFLARPDDEDRRPRREAQAEVIRRLVVREMTRGRAVAVLGDFNDYDAATPDVQGNRPITDVLATVKRAGAGPDDDLFNVMADVAQRDRFTAHYDRNGNDRVDDRGELTAIDHILLSPRLYDRTRQVTYAQFYDPATHTDHFPVVVTLEVD